MYMRGGNNNTNVDEDSPSELSHYDEIPPLKEEPWDSDNNPFDLQHFYGRVSIIYISMRSLRAI